jgi:hypothetical protein
MEALSTRKSKQYLDKLIHEHRDILFQLALASKELEILPLTELLSETIFKMVVGKSAEEIRMSFGIQPDELSTPDSDVQDLSATTEDFVVISSEDRPRSQKLQQAAQQDFISSQCNFCRVPFSTTMRKHHCRKCLKLFCCNCANEFVVIPADERQRAEQLIKISTLTKFRNVILNVANQRGIMPVRMCCVCAFELNQGDRINTAYYMFVCVCMYIYVCVCLIIL